MSTDENSFSNEPAQRIIIQGHLDDMVKQGALSVAKHSETKMTELMYENTRLRNALRELSDGLNKNNELLNKLIDSEDKMRRAAFDGGASGRWDTYDQWRMHP